MCFARDPDALLDLIELEINENLIKQEENNAICKTCIDFLEIHSPTWSDIASQDDILNHTTMMKLSMKLLSSELYQELLTLIEKSKEIVQRKTAWRIDGTLREFPKFKPINLWFEYPIHYIDKIGKLNDLDPEGDAPAWKKAMNKRKPKEQKK